MEKERPACRHRAGLCYQENRRQPEFVVLCVWRGGAVPVLVVATESPIFIVACGMFQWQHAESTSCYMWNLVPQAGIEPRPPALAGGFFIHCATREVLKLDLNCSHYKKEMIIM